MDSNMGGLRRVKHHNAFTVFHRNTRLNRLPNAQVGGLHALDAAHQPNVFFQIDQHHVVVAAGFGLAPHDAVRIDRAAPAGSNPAQILAAAMHAQHAREELMPLACGTALDLKYTFRESGEIMRFRPLGRSFLVVVHHLPSFLLPFAQRSENRPPLSASSTSKGAGSQYSPCSAWKRQMVSSTLGRPTVSA